MLVCTSVLQVEKWTTRLHYPPQKRNVFVKCAGTKRPVSTMEYRAATGVEVSSREASEGKDPISFRGRGIRGIFKEM